MAEDPLEDPLWPNKFGRIVLLSVEEILGPGDARRMRAEAGVGGEPVIIPPDDLRLAFSYQHLARIAEVSEAVYGFWASQGIAHRIGQVSFSHFLRSFSREMGWQESAFRLLPEAQKMELGLARMAEFFRQLGRQQVHFVPGEAFSTWHLSPCPFCWQRRSTRPVCQFWIGLLQEALAWLTGGKFYFIEEVACLAAGAQEDTFQIHSTPLS